MEVLPRIHVLKFFMKHRGYDCILYENKRDEKLYFSNRISAVTEKNFFA